LRPGQTVDRRALGRVPEEVPPRDAAARGAARHRAARRLRPAGELLDRLLLRESVAVPPVAARRTAARARREGLDPALHYPAFRIPAAIPLTVTTKASRSCWSPVTSSVARTARARRPRRSAPSGCNAAGTRRRSYSAAMRASVFAST